MEFEFILIFIAICGFAAFVHGSVGFGFPMLATPLMALLTDVQTAIILTIIPNLYVNFVSIKAEGRFLEALQKHYKLVLLTAFGSFIGTFILIYSNSELFKVILAFAILIYLVTDYFKIRIQWINLFPRVAKVIFGLVSGLMGGLTNVMAPTLFIYLLETNQSKQEIIQSTNLCFLFGKFVQLIMFAVALKYNQDNLTSSFIMLIIVIIFLPIGLTLKKKINELLYKKLIKALLACISIALVLQTVWS